MSYYQQRNKNRLTIGHDGNALVMLIAVQLMVFVVFAFIKIIYFFNDGPAGIEVYQSTILPWVTLPAHLPTLLARPWTLITHFFVHDSVWHLISNMLWLWMFGYILQDITGNRRLIPVFLYGAFAGAIAFLISFNLIPSLRVGAAQATALGASAGVMGVAIATTVLSPGYRLFPMLNGGIPLWVITVIFVVIDLASIPGTNSGGHIAHLAGAAAGFVFMTQFQKGRDGGKWINAFFDWVVNLFNPDKPKRGKVVKSQLFYKANVPPFKKTTSRFSQQRVDEILDKINQKGYDTLSAEEKEILKRASSEDV